MANINHHRKGIGAKLACYGPSGSGKNTNVEFLNKHTANPAALMSVPHPDGRTVSFFLPIEPHLVHGVELRIRVVTLQTRLEVDKAWQQALRECDGVVFVADSRRGAVDANKRFVQQLADDLRAVGISPTGIPILLQLNWQDASDAMTPEEASQAFNTSKWPTLVAAASQGFGVFDTATTAVRLVCKHLQKHFAELGGTGELADQVHVNLAPPKEPVELKRAGVAADALATPPPAPASAAAPVEDAASQPTTVVPEDVVDVVDAVDRVDGVDGVDEPAASVIVEPALLGVEPQGVPAVAPVPAEVPPPAALVEAPAPAPTAGPPIDAQAALAALGQIRQCAQDAQAHLGAGAALKDRILAAADQLDLLRDSAANVSTVLATLAAEQGEQAAAAPAALQEIPARLADVEALLGTYRERVESLERALKSAESTAAAKQAALTAQLEAAKAVSAQLSRLDKNLEADVAKAKDEVEAARNDLAAMRTASEQAATEIARLEGELAVALDKVVQAEQAAQETLVVAEESKGSALQQLSLAVAAGDALQAQVDALTAELQTQKAAAAAAVARAAQEVAAGMGEADQLRAQTATMQQQIEQLMSQFAESQAAAEASRVQAEELAARAQAAEAGGTEVAQLKAQIASLEAGRDEMAKAFGNYQQLALRLQQEAKEKDAKIAELKAAHPASAAAPAVPVAHPVAPVAHPVAPVAPAAPAAVPAASSPTAAKPSRPSGPGAASKPPTPAGPRTSGAVPAVAPHAAVASAAAAADPLAADPTHQSARRLAKALITEFASRFLPAITEAVAKGTFDQAFETQVKGMRKAYDTRVLASVREAHDYLQEELGGLLAEIRKGK
ncbi:MAG TPA: hypothetical protein VGK67_26825 [Myxococcales bacterium]|jgi:hypothetical protein